MRDDMLHSCTTNVAEVKREMLGGVQLLPVCS